jgi:uncharacterized cofD-like protein
MRQQISLVAIGGGTGLATLLSGLKVYVVDSRGYQSYQNTAIKTLTAIVTVTDDGGSSGHLRAEFHILPPGDIRNCMVALSEDEQLLTKLFQYRFPSRGQLQGHNFGNLFLTALTGVTGDFLAAVRLSSEILAIRGRILPSTMTDAILIAELDNGKVIKGESNISQSGTRIKTIALSPPHCPPLPETLTAIAQADIITIGPGSLFTSLIPNLLVEEIAQAIARSPALKIYIMNIMTQRGETTGLGVIDHLAALFEAAPALQLDYTVINTAPIPADLYQRYLADGAVQIGLDYANKVSLECNGRVIKVVTDDLINSGDKVRHAPAKLAATILHLYNQVTAKE